MGMKMEYWIQNADHNLWRIVQQGNSPKRLGKDAKGNTIVHPPVSLDEHVAVQRENKVRTLLLQALPEDHMPDFHHYDDARDIWMAVKARFGGNEESKKMKKTMLKQQFAEFSVTEEEGLHKGYDRFQKILSQLNQVQARPDNDDINLKSLELDVRIGHSYGVKVTAAPTHSAFIGTACSGSKPTFSDQQHIVPSVFSDSYQDMIYEDFDQVDQLEMEEMDLKWQMAMLSLRINRFEKKAGRKMNYNNQQPARFDRRKVRCYKCNTEVKTDEPKALVSVDSMVNWSDHAAENTTGAVEKVYGMMAGLHADSADASNAAAEFAMMGISPKVQNCPLGCDSKISDLNHMYNNLDRLYNDCTKERKKGMLSLSDLARFEKWKESSKNLKNLIDSSMSTRTKVGLGFQEYFGVDEVFDLSTPSVFYSDPVEKEVKPLYSTFVKAGEMHTVPPPITGTYMPSPYQSDIEETQVSYGSKSDNSISDTISESNDFVSCDNSDKSSDSETLHHVLPAHDQTKDIHLHKCFVCGSKLHLIKDCDFYNCVDSVPCKSKAASAGSRISPASVLLHPFTAGSSDSAASRKQDQVHSCWSHQIMMVGLKVQATVSAGRTRVLLVGSICCFDHISGDDGILLLRNLSSYLGGIKDHSFGNPRGDPSTDNDIGIVDSGCSRSMTGNKEKLDDFVQIKGGIVKFGGGDGRISGKGTIRTSKLDFENVYYVEELQHFNLFSVSQICDKKNKVLFTDTDCLVLTEEFQLPDESQVVLRIPRKCDLYTFSISELQPEQNVTCLVAKASLDESTRWHRRMAHVNFKTINKLAKEGLVDGLPLKVFTNEHNCVACNKGKQHKASYKHISAVRLITETLQLLHMDLFGPTNIRSIDQKYYSLVVTDDFSRFTWTFYLGTKDETFYVLKEFIALIENQLNKKVKGIRCDNGTEFKNAKLIELCGEKGIKRDYSNPRTPQQNGVAERKNRTLIEAARTMLADSKLPTMFWTEAVSTACYVLNRVSITNPHNKTPYQLLSGKVPQIGHLKPFGCQVTILNTSDHLGKFEGKADEGYLVGYAPNSKAYRVYNLTNKRVEETMNLRFLEDKPNVQGIGHEWYFDLDYLTDSLGYTRFKTDTPAGTQETNIPAGTQAQDSDSDVEEQVIVVPSFPSNSFAGPSSSNGPSVMERNADYAEELAKLQRQEYEAKDAAARYGYLFSQATAEILCQAEAEIRNQGVSAVRDPAGIDSADGVSAGSPSAGSDPAGGNPAGSFQPAGSFDPAALGDPAVSTSVSADFIPVHADASTLPPGQPPGCGSMNLVPTIRVNTIHPQSQSLGDLASPQVLETFVPLPDGKIALRDKMVFENKRMPEAIVDRNKQGWLHRGHDKRRALTTMSGVKSAFLYGEIEGKKSPEPVCKIVYFSVTTQLQKSQDKYVKDMLTKFDMESVRTATTPYEAAKTKLKDDTDPPVNVHLYRSMIGSLMYLTASRPDIMFAVSACSRHQVTPLTSHLNAVKKIFNLNSIPADYVSAGLLLVPADSDRIC
ncbi:putative ribonuclease H-like domain-containing protein [Tanacetum coccineum]|uniref:Ribonuclease H-like domain-containing protein n=1 Tax=Tanacetum coccineum TaxID=301880 RepID=A0ABQ5ABG8_9ASTR